MCFKMLNMIAATSSAYPSSRPESDDRHHFRSSTAAKSTNVRAEPTRPVISASAQSISEWLHELRLHKYAENLQSVSWKEMLDLTDAALEKLGVSTQGARSKLLKVCIVFLLCHFVPPPGTWPS